MTRSLLPIVLKTLSLLLILTAITLFVTDMAQADSPRRQLTYFSQRYRDSRVNIVDIDRRLTVVLLSTDGLVTNMAWSPDGERLALNIYTETGIYELRLFEIGHLEVEILNQQWVSHSALSWSPDGMHTAFTRRENSQSQVFVVDTTDGALIPIAPELQNTSGPSWSPDGTQLAFAGQGFTGESEIFALDMACLESGCPPRRLTGNPATDHMPVWSPDGTHIAFVSNRDVFPLVHVMAAECGQAFCVPHQVNTLRVTSEPPVWSPDSRWLVVSVDTATNGVDSTLQLVDTQTWATYRITRERNALNVVSWSADSQLVAYIADFMNIMDVMVQEVDCIVMQAACAADALPVTQHNANVWGPVWRP